MTQQALNASIEKWLMNAKAETPDGYFLGSNTCPLCRIYHPSYRTEEAEGCDGCPIKEMTGHDFCDGTPYAKAAMACSDWTVSYGFFPEKWARRKARQAASEMVKFLMTVRLTIYKGRFGNAGE